MRAAQPLELVFYTIVISLGECRGRCIESAPGLRYNANSHLDAPGLRDNHRRHESGSYHLRQFRRAAFGRGGLIWVARPRDKPDTPHVAAGLTQNGYTRHAGRYQDGDHQNEIGAAGVIRGSGHGFKSLCNHSATVRRTDRLCAAFHKTARLIIQLVCRCGFYHF